MPFDSESTSTESREQASETSTRESKVLYGFRIVYVFDVSQTEGQDLPEFASLGGDPGDKIQRIEQIIRDQGIALEFADNLPHGANGMSSGGTITIAANLPKPQMFGRCQITGSIFSGVILNW